MVHLILLKILGLLLLFAKMLIQLRTLGLGSSLQTCEKENSNPDPESLRNQNTKSLFLESLKIVSLSSSLKMKLGENISKLIFYLHWNDGSLVVTIAFTQRNFGVTSTSLLITEAFRSANWRIC